MSETKTNGSNNRTEQTWIKDVLSKSGIELMEFTTTRKTQKSVVKVSGKRVTKKPCNGATTAKETKQKMVYYQSTPLVIKSEKPMQAQCCTALQTSSTVTFEAIPKVEMNSVVQIKPGYQLKQSSSNMHNCNNVAIMQPQHQKSSNKSIITNNIVQTPAPNLSMKAPNIHLHTNIKTESNIDIEVYGAASSETSTISISTTTISKSDNAITPDSKNAINRKPSGNKPQFKCEQCGMTFGSKSAHTSHTKSHMRNLDLSVGIGTVTTKLAEISGSGVQTANIPKTSNITGVTGSDPYQCNVCQKTFAVPARLIRHYRTHTGERPFECEFCHKLFSVKENLQVHRRIHTKERPYKCDVCERAFEHSGKLHRHMRIHTGERPHKCSVCEKTFIQSGQLVIHMRTHTGEKPYKCPVEGCGKGFTCSKQLKVHSRTHTGEKPYHCDICFRDFGYNHVLKLHRVQHYGSKCYKCTICDETFKSKKEMEAHIKGHSRELPDDDDMVSEPVAGTSNGNMSTSTSSGSSGEATSMPGSPFSPLSAGARKLKDERTNAVSIKTSPNPRSPSPHRSTLSPNSTLLASASLLSDDSKEFLPTSSQTKKTLELENHSAENEEDSTSNNSQLSLTLCTKNSTKNKAKSFTYIINKIPTDLSNQQLEVRQFEEPITTKFYQRSHINDSIRYHNQSTVPTNYRYQHTQHQIEPPTINPALIEAASIVRRRDMLDSPCEEEDVPRDIRLKRSQKNNVIEKPKCHDYQNQPQLVSSTYETESPYLTASSIPTILLASQRLSSPSQELSQYDDSREANELIEHYRRGELAQHGLHKGYAPVPKYEPSLLNNEIVRQVEAAIAPLRSSTESPERSSSPESDSMMMANRDVMTLPLRKRKLYMHDGSPIGASFVNRPKRERNKPFSHLSQTSIISDNNTPMTTANINDETGSKVMRMSSVIQFAKAS